jgi:uncharacterized protein (TIGR02598 family)
MHQTMPLPKPLRSKGFSLVEVVVAVGIFAITIVGVLGLLAPTSKNIADVSDSDAAARVISVIQSGLQGHGFNSVTADLAKTFYASKSGDKIGASDSSVWTAAGVTNQDKYFEFTLVRNQTLSPATADASAGYLAFTIVLKWPAFVPSADGQGTPVDNAAKSVMVVPAAITR